MVKQLSFTKHENKMLPKFREKINKAESNEDLKKFFVYTVIELFETIFQEKMDFHYEDIALNPDSEPYYVLSNRLRESPEFGSVWKDSDLPHVVYRMAESAIGRYRHLEKHPEKTDAKIRM